MFPFLIAIPLLTAFSSSGSFPKPLSREEEQRCLQQFLNSTEEEREAAKRELILHNLRLVAHIAKKYASPQRDQEELISIGIVGLIKAILSYNAEKSIRLATYASRCIENEILMSLRYTKKFQNDVSLHEPIGTDRDGNELVMLDVINVELPDFHTIAKNAACRSRTADPKGAARYLSAVWPMESGCADPAGNRRKTRHIALLCFTH